MNLAHYFIILPIVALLVISIIRFIYFGQRLNKLMIDKYREEWKGLTTIPGFGPGCSNPFRSLPFLFNKQDFGDKEVLRLKIKIRNSFLFAVVSIPALFFSIDAIIRYMDKVK